MITKIEKTWWVRIYMSGPIEIAKQVCREMCMEDGLCLTIDSTQFIYTGGEESGYVIGLINYPRFPSTPLLITERAAEIARLLLARTFQHCALIMTPTETVWITNRE
jgi:hypothetical protein